MSVGNLVMSDITSIMEIVLVARRFVPVGPVWCYIHVFLRTFSFNQSILFITVVAVIRAWSGLASHPVNLTTRSALACVVCVYVTSSVSAALWVLPSASGISLCMGRLQDSTPLSVIVSLLSVVVILFFITLVSYICLTVSLHCKNKQSTAVIGSKKSEILTLKAAITVSITFLLCYLLPFLAAINFRDVPIHGYIHVLGAFNSLAYLQSVINPYIYLVTNQHFRRVFVRTCNEACVFWKRGRGRVDITDSSTVNQELVVNNVPKVTG